MATVAAKTVLGAGNKLDCFPLTLATSELTAATTADYIHNTIGDATFSQTGSFTQKTFVGSWQTYDITEAVQTHLDTYNVGITPSSVEQLFENGDKIVSTTAPDVDKILLYVRYGKAVNGKIPVTYWIGFYSGDTGVPSSASTTAFTSLTMESTAWNTQYLVNIPTAVFDATIVTPPAAALTIPIGSQGATVFLDPA